MQKRVILTGALVFTAFAAISITAQSAKRKIPANKAIVATSETPKAVPEAETTVKVPSKKNGRPGEAEPTQERTNKRPEKAEESKAAATDPTHFYEFSQPEFLISKVIIEHDEAGNGKISFLKKGYDELISDPIQVSAEALGRIGTAFTALNFLDSTESYQFEKDYSHLGVLKIRLKDQGKERAVTFNWTQNKDAKTLADEYRKIGNQFIWMFDIAVARENQPLEAPKLLDSLDSLIRRNEISDPKQMLPYLQKMTDDERFPLIARNHAAKLIKQIEKEASN